MSPPQTFAVPLQNTRNITVLAHVDHGKTSLVDCLLSANNIISARLAGKIRFMDSREDEQERGITMESSAVSLRFQMLRRRKEGEADQSPHHILNLIDTPGHVDFASEVSTAARLCDGALVLVDSVEGVCTQTIAVLRQAWLDNLKPILVINKLDRFITELKLTPSEAYHHLNQLIEQVNAVMGSFFASARMEDDLRWREMREQRLKDRQLAKDAAEDAGGSGTNTPAEQAEDDADLGEFEEQEDEDLYFAPERGNVIFASAIDGWAFRLGKFAQLYGAKLGIQEHKLRKVLWGDYYLDPKSKRVIGRKKAASLGKTLKPMFVQFVLDNIWRVYETVLEEHNPDKVQKIVTALNVRVSPRDLRSKDTRSLVNIIFQQWLPLSTCVFQAVVDVIPSPSGAQPIRLPRMLYPTIYTSPSTGAVKPNNTLESDLYTCNQADDANVVAYVSKMFAVPRTELPEHRRKELSAEDMRRRGREERERRAAMAADETAMIENAREIPVNGSQLSAVDSSTMPNGDNTDATEDKSGEALIGFARIYSGVIRIGDTVQCILPKFNTSLPADHPMNAKHNTTAEISNLYMMMGRELVPVDFVPAGNIFAIGGLEGKVLRNATLCKLRAESKEEDAQLVNLAGVAMQSAPIVRVALEPENPVDLPKLVEGLRLLNQADPCVEVLVQETGEHVILTAGELHLERCLKDLRERFAKCAISASEAIVPFRETAVKQADMNASRSTLDARGRFSGSSVASLVNVTIRAALLPLKVVEFLQSQANTIANLLVERDASREEDARIEGVPNASEGNVHVVGPKEFWGKLEELFKQAGGEWQDVADSIWAFGPKRVGPNMLIDRTQQKRRSLRSKSEQLIQAREEGKTAAEVAELVESLANTAIEDTIANGEAKAQDNSSTMLSMLRDFDGNIETGFQLANQQGPLCAEPVVGMAYFVEKVEVADMAGQEDTLRTRMPQVTGSLISLVKDLCHEGLLDWSPRIKLAMYSCDIQASTDVLGKVYAVVARRRGRIVSEEMKEGTSFFSIRAMLPVVESFGFADEIRKRTSGAASPQLVFAGFEMLDQDPFWVPTTEEELEDFGEKADRANIAKVYVDQVRKRKGMFVEQKVVEHAEKQRTLKR
ncbi:Cytoplasmic GTPase/eEF2-like protein (ribosomal biogenesis) [Naganishia albida]|nr:Cytoplasmic GTPase/eEF2-like protein (ribosomal biogenesis) [Naganishia albida]